MPYPRELVRGVLIGGLAALGGCGDERPPGLPGSAYESSLRTPVSAVTGVNRPSAQPPTPATPLPSGTADTWTGRAEIFRGDLGDVARFDDSAAVLEASSNAASSTVRIDAEDASARWWAMTRLDITGTLAHPALVPGARLVFTRGVTAPTPAGTAPLTVRAIGCSGPRHGDARFDRPADQVTVAVSAGPTADTQRMDFTASFASESGNQQVTGSFVYELR